MKLGARNVLVTNPRDMPRFVREQIDIDSFDFLNVIIRLHEVLGVEIPERDYAELTTLDGAVEYLARRSGGSDAQPAGKSDA